MQNINELPLEQRKNALLFTKQKIEARLYQLQSEIEVHKSDLQLTLAALSSLEGLDVGTVSKTTTGGITSDNQ